MVFFLTGGIGCSADELGGNELRLAGENKQGT
jgi:hypothetical protein